MTIIPIHLKRALLFPVKDLSGKYCLSPFVMIEVTLNGGVRLCGCGDWMPTVIGNLTKNTLEEILSSPLAQRIRQSIIDGTYQYCDEQYCGVMANGELNTIDTVPDNVKNLITNSELFEIPHWISVQGDEVCNLSCPSCRTAVIKPKQDEIKEREQIGKIMSENLFSRPTDKKIILQISSSGEIFASPLLINFLSSISLNRLPNFQLHIQSNGLMAQKNWHKISHLEPSIRQVLISIDAATAETYQVVRRGGTWKQLTSAMKFLQKKKHELGFDFRTRMVIQNRNYQEIHQFYDFCKSYDVDRIEYAKVSNYAWSEQEFREHNVFDLTHPNYAAAKEEMLTVQKLPSAWFQGIF